MLKYTRNRILEHLRQELTITEVKAREIGNRFEILRREIESIKVVALQNHVDEQRKSSAFDRGFTSLIKDRERVRYSSIAAAGGIILGGLLARDSLRAVTGGISGFSSMVQVLGDSKWCVLLGKKISVVPEEAVPPQAIWISLDNFYRVMEELKKRALAGERLGSLDGVIAKLIKKHG